VVVTYRTKKTVAAWTAVVCTATKTVLIIESVIRRRRRRPGTSLSLCEIITTQSRLKPEVAPSHNDVIWQLNGILTAHLNLAGAPFERQQRQVHKSNFTHGMRPRRDWTSQRVRGGKASLQACPSPPARRQVLRMPSSPSPPPPPAKYPYSPCVLRHCRQAQFVVDFFNFVRNQMETTHQRTDVRPSSGRKHPLHKTLAVFICICFFSKLCFEFYWFVSLLVLLFSFLVIFVLQ